MISVVIYLQTVCLLSGELNEPGSRSDPDVSLHVILYTFEHIFDDEIF